MYSYNKHNEKKHFCRYCLHAYSKKELLVNHISDCYAINGTQKVSLPDEDHKILKFTNYDKQLKVPFVIYADFESITEPIESRPNPNPNESYTSSYQLHTPCSFAYKVVCINDKYTKDCVIYRGENCVEKNKKLSRI